MRARGGRLMVFDPRHTETATIADDHQAVQLDDAGQVEPKLEMPRRDGTTHWVMSPPEFMQRLAAQVPRPRSGCT